MIARVIAACVLCLGVLSAPLLVARQSDASYFAEMRWRLVGPNRAGRVSAVAGVPGNPAVYYIGAPDGGLWMTTSGGTVWTPIAHDLPSSAIGMVAVAPSDSNVVYVGTGHNGLGKGVFRSADAGATWQAAGLTDTKYITGLLIDPRDANTVLVGVGSGGNFGSMVYYNNNPTPVRGVYRTTDGGKTWTHTLFVDAASSVVDLVEDPSWPAIVYAGMSGGARLAPAGADAGGAAPAPAGPAIYKSADGGATWARLAHKGLPPNAASANIAVAPRSGGRKLCALVGGGGGGVFRSDDSGETWVLMTNRIASGSGHVYFDPGGADWIYLMGTSMYRSLDGGRTFEAYKGAPGGDDNREMWIDPQNGNRMIIGADQGPTITLDGGRTWTPWYVVPNGEHYFVSTDNQFPYWIYAAQQDSGTVAIRSRSDFGRIRPNDWYPVSGYEQGHIFADPFDPRYVISHGNGHAIVRYDRVTGQSGPIYTPKEQDRFGPRPAMELSKKDPHWLFVGAQYVMATTDRGVTWRQISPDLTVKPAAAATAPTAPPAGRAGRAGGAGGRAGGAGGPGGGGGTIVALAPSPLDVNVLWAGTSNGLIHVTRDGGTTWKDVSPPRLAGESTLTLWSMEASSHDLGAAYATAIDLSDTHAPCIFRTLDFGATWQEIVHGMTADVPTRVVREDPERANLLYAGTQAGAWVSFDRGDSWQPLQLNLPRVAVNDIAIHGDDAIIATWGRGLWALDDVTPLRQIEAVRASTDPAFLFAPATAMRVRGNNNQDTPLPPEVIAGQNPPDGAVIDYYLPRPVSGSVTVAIHDAQGGLVREFTSDAPVADQTMPNVPLYWFKPPQGLPTGAGMHRIVWDVRYPTPPSLNYGGDGEPGYSTSYGIIASAVVGESPRQQPVGPLALPGTYQVRLTAAGRTVTRPLTVTNDPRVVIGAEDLAAALTWQRGLAAGIKTSHDAIEQIRALRPSPQVRDGLSDPRTQAATRAFDRSAVTTISSLAGARALGSYLASLEFADMRLTDSTISALRAACGRADDALARYRQWVTRDLDAYNRTLSPPAIPTKLPVPPAGPACASAR